MVKGELLFDNEGMEYVTTTYGERRIAHREDVDVYARFGRDGAIEPVCVMWKDGRSFRIDEVLEVMPFGALCRGRQTARYRVRFGRHETTLYLERRCAPERAGTDGADAGADGSDSAENGERLTWWVYAYDTTKQRDAGNGRWTLGPRGT